MPSIYVVKWKPYLGTGKIFTGFLREGERVREREKERERERKKERERVDILAHTIHVCLKLYFISLRFQNGRHGWVWDKGRWIHKDNLHHDKGTEVRSSYACLANSLLTKTVISRYLSRKLNLSWCIIQVKRCNKIVESKILARTVLICRKGRYEWQFNRSWASK